MERYLTCIICPKGCSLKVVMDDNKNVISVEGNTCKRGKDYAIAECTSPVRTVTSTMRTEGGEVVSVKTAAPVPKDKVFDVMREINGRKAPTRVKLGDVLIENVALTGVDVVATSDR